VEIFKLALQNEADYCLRGDSKELLVSLIALGKSLTTGVYRFKTLGTLHNARFEIV
jgi:hypothetical protein